LKGAVVPEPTPPVFEPPILNPTSASGGDGVGPLPSAPPDERPAAKGDANQTTNIHDLDADSAEFYNNFHGDIIKNYFQTGESSLARPFSPRDASHPTPAKLEEITSLFIADESFIARLLADLAECRILLLTGAEGSGRAMTALYLATQLSRANGLAHLPQAFDRLERETSIDLRKQASDAQHFGGRVTVFNDIFYDQNRSLLNFFSTPARAVWEEFAATLRDNDAWMIFTADTDAVARLRHDVSDCIARHELRPLAPELVDAGFERKLIWLAAKGCDPKKLDELEQRRAEVVAVHPTLSKIVSFIDQFVRSDLPLADLLKRSAKPDFWFLGTLTRDVDAWCFALALVLAQPLLKSKPVPWLDFERFRRAVAEKLKSEDELFPSGPVAGGDGERTAAASLHDRELLRLCEAVIEKSSGQVGDVVRFVDKGRAEALWPVLLENNRRVLTELVSALRPLAEQDRAAGRVSLRSLAAQTVGRIGELDPLRIAAPLIQHWAGSSGLRAMVGQLLQGVVSSEDHEYRNLVYDRVAALVTPLEEVDERGKAAARDRLMTAIAAYAQAALYDPKSAMRRLGGIVIDRLAPLLAGATSLATPMIPPANGKKKPGWRLVWLARRLSRDYAGPIVAVQNAIVFLCNEGDLLRTIDAIQGWMSRGGATTAGMVALLFFVDGIADDLGEALLAALQERKNGIRDFCSFLADLYAVIADPYILPTPLQTELRQCFAHTLSMWARHAADDSSYRTIVEDLFVAFAAARGDAFRRDLYLLLGSDEFFTDAAMRAFAAEVRQRMSGNSSQKGQSHATQLRPRAQE
jgi:hypothetical protein